ncbi:MAG: phenylalanine 4-monooxygenase [Myxococcota bacterium]
MSASLYHHVIDSEEAERALAEGERQATLPASAIDLRAMTITQHAEKYRDVDHRVWRSVFDRRMEELREDGSQVFLEGMETIRLSNAKVPVLDEINGYLEPMTGWRSVAVPGYLPPRSFFAFLARRRFPTTISVRPPEQIEYLPEPDIIHDVFGHVPLHADPAFADFLQTYGRTALAVSDHEASEGLARLFWFTVEFGLVQEKGETKLYGAGLLSSPGEGRHALRSPEVDRRPFDLDTILATDFEIDHFQPILYVLDSFEQLRDAMLEHAGRLQETGHLDLEELAAVDEPSADLAAE